MVKVQNLTQVKKHRQRGRGEDNIPLPRVSPLHQAKSEAEAKWLHGSSTEGPGFLQESFLPMYHVIPEGMANW